MLILNTVTKAQSSYCPLIWMFWYMITKERLIWHMNKVHGKTLRIVFNGYITDFQTLLQKGNDISSYHRNIPTLSAELDTVLPIIDLVLNMRNLFNISEICKRFSHKETELPQKH